MNASVDNPTLYYARALRRADRRQYHRQRPGRRHRRSHADAAPRRSPIVTPQSDPLSVLAT
jgi:hypothetical protein